MSDVPHEEAAGPGPAAAAHAAYADELGRRQRARASAPATVICLAGPTASGKSAAAMAIAARWPAEIVSVDSAQVYRGMDIGTAKPTAAERAKVAHHLIDLLDPSQAYSAARFVDDARRAIEGIHSRGSLPILVGGTMLYFKALWHGLDEIPDADPATRAALRAEIDREALALGWPALHAALAAVDPVTAARLPPTDAQRIQRALEVWRSTGKPLSSFHRQGAGPQASAGRADTQASGMLVVSMEPSERAWLHHRIDTRLDTMMAAGLLDEVRALRARPELDRRMPSMRCVGYRQLVEALDRDGDPLPAESLQMALAAAKAATRQLAKRQLTWLRSVSDRRVVACDARDAAEQVVALVSACR